MAHLPTKKVKNNGSYSRGNWLSLPLASKALPDFFSTSFASLQDGLAGLVLLKGAEKQQIQDQFWMFIFVQYDFLRDKVSHALSTVWAKFQVYYNFIFSPDLARLKTCIPFTNIAFYGPMVASNHKMAWNKMLLEFNLKANILGPTPKIKIKLPIF